MKGAIMLGDKMAIATVPVGDLDKSIEFYTEMLGLKVMRKGNGEGSVGAGMNTNIEMYYKPNAASDNTIVTFLVDDIEKEMGELKGKGVVFEEYNMPEFNIVTENGIATWEDGSKGAWLKDPDGNILSLVSMK
jgi:catechol 2,3-dioxygenase-like lactoylglutathione lyase family enzyme